MDMKKTKCIVWGIGNDYEKILNQLLFEIHKQNIEVEALVCREKDRYCSNKDGFPIYTKDEIMSVEFDCIIITSSKYFKEIREEIQTLFPNNNKWIINGKVFKLPLFDFGRYIHLIKNPVTILSDDCWGGYVYNRLGLKFSSPLINIYWDRDEYAKFIQNPLFYLQSELTMFREGDLKEGICP